LSYGLVTPTNSFRIIDSFLERYKIETDVKMRSVAHGKSLTTFSTEIPEIDAKHLMSSQSALIFNGKAWIKRRKVIDYLDKLQIPDAPLSQIDLILPSLYDGKSHRTTFALINPHSQMFKKMTQTKQIPREQLLKIHQDFRRELSKFLSKPMFRFLRASIMLMVDTNPGKEEMYNKDFVLGLRQPFMQKVVATPALWECTDYEVL